MEPRALIVEDDNDIADLFAEALEAAGYHPEIAGDGTRAIASLTETMPPLVVLDLHLPWVHGERILSTIHTDPRLAKTHVIVISADSQAVERLEGQADYTLVKPVTFTQLRDLAARLHPDHRDD